MAIKAGQIVHAGNETVVIDRIQTGGPGQLNIPTEKIYELGNFKSVGTIRDTPDLSFSLESYDVSTEVETMLAGAYAGRSVADAVTNGTTTVTSASAGFTSADVGRMIIIPGDGVGGGDYVSTVASVTNGTTIVAADAVTGTGTGRTLKIVPNGIDLATAVPIDIASQFKAGQTVAAPYDVVGSVALPFLYVESMSYRFGYRDNASQSASLRGDTIFYNPGATYVQTATGTNSANQAVATVNPAYASAEADGRRVLSVTVGAKRLTFGVDYTESYGAITSGAATTTVTIIDAVPTTSTIRIVYCSPTLKQYLQAVHPLSTVKPAAVRGKDIAIYLGGYDPADPASSLANKVKRIQSANIDWRVQIDRDQELGNHYATGLDFDVPAVSGSIDFRPADPAELQALIRKFTGVTDPYKAVGPSSADPMEMDVVVMDPDTGLTLKRIHVPDARFTLPGFAGRIQTKLNVTANFESDEGTMLVYER